MLVRALKVLDYFQNGANRHGIATAALDQPGDEGWAYDRARTKWQPLNLTRTPHDQAVAWRP
jgi:hypothetical protein